MELKVDTPIAEALFEVWLSKDYAVQTLAERLSYVEPPLRHPPDYDDGDAYLFESMQVDLAACRYLYQWTSIWSDSRGQKKMWSNTPAKRTVSVRPWDVSYDLGFRPRHRITNYLLHRAAEAAWNDMTTSYLSELAAGSITAYASVATPMAEPSPIGRQAWRYVDDICWEEGVATLSDGTQLFSLIIRTGPPEVVPPSRRKAKSPRDHAKDVLREIYGAELPTGKWDVVVADVHAAWGSRRGAPPSQRTVKRAVAELSDPA